MSATRGVIAGVLGLSLLQATLASAQATKDPKDAGALGSAFTLATGVFRRLVDPTVALIPDRRSSTPAATPSAYITTTPDQAGGGTLRPAATGQTLIPA